MRVDSSRVERLCWLHPQNHHHHLVFINAITSQGWHFSKELRGAQPQRSGGICGRARHCHCLCLFAKSTGMWSMSVRVRGVCVAGTQKHLINNCQRYFPGADALIVARRICIFALKFSRNIARSHRSRCRCCQSPLPANKCDYK